MIEIPSDISQHDLSQWLEGGVFFARPEGGDDWMIASLCGQSEGRVDVRWVRSGDRSILPLSEVRGHWPTCGSINMPNFALYVQRMQRRQWRRTFNGRCVRVSVPGKWQHLKQLSAASLRIDVNEPVFLEALFNPTYPSNYSEAMYMLRSRPSVAMSPQIIMVGHPNPVVYYRGERVGTILGSKFQPECGDMTTLRIGKLIGVAV